MDLNHRPKDYESSALTTELHPRASFLALRVTSSSPQKLRFRGGPYFPGYGKLVAFMQHSLTEMSIADFGRNYITLLRNVETCGTQQEEACFLLLPFLRYNKTVDVR